MNESVARDPSPAQAGEGSPADALHVENVVRRFGGVTAVNDVSLTVRDGERLAVIGPNGAGKTTLFRLIAGEMPPTSGQVRLFGRDVTRMPAHRRARLGLSRTFQVSTLFSGLSVADNIQLAAQAGDSSRLRPVGLQAGPPRIAGRVSEMLERVGLIDRRDDEVAALSHGEKRQLEIGMALVTSPRILLLDEPAAGLSGGERLRLRGLIESLPAELPVLLIEHDMSLALDLSDRVLCLDNGRPIALGTPSDIRANTFVREVYLGKAADDAAAG